MYVRGFITGVARRDVCYVCWRALCLRTRARARATSLCEEGRYVGAEGWPRAGGDPFFSVSPVLSSLPFYARALLC